MEASVSLLQGDPGAARLPVLGEELGRPESHCVNRPTKRLRHLPQFLDPELPHLRLASVGQAELLDRRAGEVAPTALGQHGRLGLDVRPRLEVPTRLAVLAAPLLAGAHPEDLSVPDDLLRDAGLLEY